ncbi:hypothetical protein AUC60_21305 [Pseudomonas caspiana]|uniref:Uncharacterized protein n=1 Tax=Pseudomonas caspiana TaxID=1451454 RepID=A0A1Y3NW83_9PSED|nr:hypothetical protein AUC60_21305 [Pseudomonas caspiana]
MIAVVDESGLEGQDISKYLHGQIALDRFEHAGTHPLFMIFHWHLSSTGADHSVSIMDNYFRMRDFLAKNLNHKNRGIEKMSIVLPPDLASGRGWIVEEFVEAFIEKKIKGRPTHIIYKTLLHSYKYLLSDAVDAPPPDQRVILKNISSFPNNRYIPKPKTW